MYKFIVIVLVLAAIPLSASARYYGHHRDHSGVSIGFGYGAPVYPAYPSYRTYPRYPAYYAPQPVYVEPQPIIVQEIQPYDNYARPVDATRYDQGYCREYTRNVKINGRIEQGYGTACQQVVGR